MLDRTLAEPATCLVITRWIDVHTTETRTPEAVRAQACPRDVDMSEPAYSQCDAVMSATEPVPALA